METVQQQRVNSRDSRHANYVISKLSNQTISFMKRASKLDEEALFDCMYLYLNVELIIELNGDTKSNCIKFCIYY